MSLTDDLEEKWKAVQYRFIQLTGKKPSLNTMLFLIGIQELGAGKKTYTKEEKQDLMHIAVCKLLSYSGYYELEFRDQDGWPHWKQLKPIPKLDLEKQEEWLQGLIIEYFDELDGQTK